MFVSPNGPPAYLLSRWVFLRLLGLTYLLAFVSLGAQVTGLVLNHRLVDFPRKSAS